MCFKLFDYKSSVIKNTMYATMRQLFSITFEAFTHMCEEKSGEKTLNESMEKKKLINMSNDAVKQVMDTTLFK
jgi:hypothetical protein